MRLHAIDINGFRRLANARFVFGDATFLIGPNNAGKSSLMKAIEVLLSAKKSLSASDYFSVVDDTTGETKPATDTVIITAEFRNLPVEAVNWRGFKGRIFKYSGSSQADTGLSITYRKTFKFGADVVVECRALERTRSEKFKSASTAGDLIRLGANETEVREAYDNDEGAKITTKAGAERLEQVDSVWEIGENVTWVQNPGGIPGVVLHRLPRLLTIPAETAVGEIDGSNGGVLAKTLAELFEQVRGASSNFSEARKYLESLALELDPSDPSSEFGKMLIDLNGVLASVFPDARLHARASLSDPQSVLRPTFSIEMSSNVRTPVSHQGSGIIRAAAFGMLRFRQRLLSSREDQHNRTLIVCFEEPEIYLHPSAANQMRDTIYELSGAGTQIVATTHSPFLIDLSRKPRQVLNRLSFTPQGIAVEAFNATDAFLELTHDDQQYVKMLLRVDDHVARVFFTKHVVVVEGDTEDIVLRESLKRLPKESYLRILADFEIVKARGKGSIIGLVKYLRAMGIQPIVIHDRDQGVDGAEVFNVPIARALGNDCPPIVLEECVENVLGYPPPAREKPFRAFEATSSWPAGWDGVPLPWKAVMKRVFGAYLES